MAMLVQLIDDVVANKFELRKTNLDIGRHPDNHIQIADTAVSGRHACLEVRANEHFPDFPTYFLTDLNSTNGTFINGKKITGSHRLHHDDEVRIAWNKFKFVDDSEAALERTTPIIPTP